MSILKIPRSWTISLSSNMLYKWSDEEQLIFSYGYASFYPECLLIGFNWKEGGEFYDKCDASETLDFKFSEDIRIIYLLDYPVLLFN